MVARALFGNKGGVYGGWISKPGYDVISAQPGQFMLDTNSQIFQPIAKGVQSLLTVGNSANPPGDYYYAVGLPPEFAAYSDLVVTGVLYYTSVSTGAVGGLAIGNRKLRMRVVSGVLNFVLYLPFAEGPTGTNPNAAYTYYAAYTVFRNPVQ